jgi:cytochrome P450
MSSFGGLRRSHRRPPRHTKLRSLVSKGFTPRQVARLNDNVADMAGGRGCETSNWPGPVERVRSNLMNGMHSMPVTFTPRCASGSC